MRAFQHAVASGDPLHDRVVIWTRVTTEAPGPVDLQWTVARDPDLADVVTSGSTQEDPDADHTVHVDVTGLEPDTRYWYGFHALGENSAVGRTKTLPLGPEQVRFAQCSCAKYAAGFFNVYGRIADRDDLDFVLHLGDFIYEVGNKPGASATVGPDIGRYYVPDHECVTLEDYRARYAHYRLDPDIQRLGVTHPVIATVDDHEFADDCWRGGSAEHLPERDGPWEARLAAAFRARWDWHPYRMPDPADPSRVFQQVHLGELADLFMLDSRSRRDEPAKPPASDDPGRTQLGTEQARWLFDALERSPARWRILGNNTVIAPVWQGDHPQEVKEALAKLEMIEEDASGPAGKHWDGYPAERERIFARLRALQADLVVLSGDVHIAMGNELVLPGDDEPFGVEFVTTSVTSQNLDDKRGWEPRTRSLPIEQALMATNTWTKFVDMDSHGYLVHDVTPERVRSEFWFVDKVLEPTDGEHAGPVFEVRHGERRLRPVAQPAEAR